MHAEYNLGVMYRDGLGIDKDADAAFDRFKAAADLGYAVAKAEVGISYYFGRVPPKAMKTHTIGFWMLRMKMSTLLFITSVTCMKTVCTLTKTIKRRLNGIREPQS